MGGRLRASVGALAASVAVLALALSTGLAGQTLRTPTPPTKSADPWRTPRTVDGHPDLAGVWNFATRTPLERPAQFAGKMFMTEQEAVEFEKQSEAAQRTATATPL